MRAGRCPEAPCPTPSDRRVAARSPAAGEPERRTRDTTGSSPEIISLTHDPVDVLVDELMTRHGIDPTTAITVLVRAARRKGVDLDELATTIVAGPAPCRVEA